MRYGLDNGFRSKCHLAPIKIGFKTIKKTKLKIKVWVCTRCGARDVAIIAWPMEKSQIIYEDSFDDVNLPE